MSKFKKEVRQTLGGDEADWSFDKDGSADTALHLSGVVVYRWAADSWCVGMGDREGRGATLSVAASIYHKKISFIVDRLTAARDAVETCSGAHLAEQ